MNRRFILTKKFRQWTQLLWLSMLSLCIQTSSAGESKWMLSRLGDAPSWERLDPFQGTITREEFVRELTDNYAAEETAADNLIEIQEDRALIKTATKRPDEVYELRFAPSAAATVARTWRPLTELPPLRDPARPLEGMRIVIDPGHIGGEWAKMEERWFIMPKKPAPALAAAPAGEPAAAEPEAEGIPVKEGEIVLRVAELLEANLTKLGARVALVRRQLRPVTPSQPDHYLEFARQYFGFSPEASPETDLNLRRAAERLFYLSAEIRARGKKVNDSFRPDLALCLHVNAEGWGDPANPSFVDKNHFHILINGCYSREELMEDDGRHQMLLRLLQRMHSYELEVASAVADHMGPALDLPPYQYLRANAKRVSDNPFVWSRNLLASRIYECPVIYFEPHVMNHQLTYSRVQAGEYDGVREFEGKPRINFFQEYANAVSEGLAAYYRTHRPMAPAP